MAQKKRKSTTKPQQAEKHPAEWQKDLNPDRLAGQNIGAPEALRSGAEFEEIRSRLADFTDEELGRIRIVAPGERLQQGAVYLDLRGSSQEPFTATGEMSAEGAHLYAAKAETPYEIWNRLVETVLASGNRPGDVTEKEVDKALADSFPTSDPPAWTTGREPAQPGAPEAPREKRADPDERDRD